jgi:hypothetical protein
MLTIMSISDPHMINLWNQIQFVICIASQVLLSDFDLLLIWFGIYLHLATANKILTNFKSSAQL